MLISRIGASRGRHGLIGKWKAAEVAAQAWADRMPVTILRTGSILGGPYDSLGWRSRDESLVVDTVYRAADVQSGDRLGVIQPGYGTSRRLVAGAVATALRRDGRPGGVAEYTVVSLPCSQSRGSTDNAAAWDALFAQAHEAIEAPWPWLRDAPRDRDAACGVNGGDSLSAAASASTTTASASLAIDLTDKRLAPLTKPQEPSRPNLLDVLFASPAISVHDDNRAWGLNTRRLHPVLLKLLTAQAPISTLALPRGPTGSLSC